MKTRKPSIIKSILFSSLLVLIPYALVPHAGTAIGYLDNGAIAQACPIGTYVVDPASRTIDAGGSTSFKVTVTIAAGHNNFNGPINLSVTGLPSTGVSTNFPMNIYDDSDQDRDAVGVLSIDSTCAVTPGTYNLKITISAVYDKVLYTKYAYATLIITPPTGNFTISGGDQTPADINPGESADFTIAGAFTGCFGGSVSLSVDESTLPAGVTDWFFSPNTITSDNTTSTLTVATGTTTPAGEYNITVRGVSGDLSDDTVVTLVVTEPAPCFSVDVHPENRTIKAGEEGENDFFTVVVKWCDGYTGDVQLAVDGLPAGVTYKFDDNPISPGGNSDNGNAETKLRIYSTCDTPPGEYTITVTGTADTGVAYAKMVSVEPPSGTATLTVTEGDGGFKLTAGSQTPSKIYPGESAEFNITGTFAGCFTGPISLSVDESTLPTGVSVESFNPGTITAGSPTSTLTLKTSESTPAGKYEIIVTGTHETLGPWTATVDLTVTERPQDFSLSAGPTPQEIGAGDTATFDATGTFTEGFTGEVKLSLKDTPSGLSGSFSPESISPEDIDSVLTITTGADTKPGTYEITITGTHATLGTRTTTVTLVVTKPQDFTLSADPTEQEIEAGDKADFKVMGTFSEGFEGDVELSVAVSPSGPSGSFSPGKISVGSPNSTLTITDAKPGTYEITIRGKHNTLGERTTVVKLTVTKPQDFTISARPTEQEILAGGTADFAVIGSFAEGFEGEVALSAAVSPSGPSVSFSPEWISLKDIDSVLTVTTDVDTKPGQYEITIKGTHKTLGERTTKVTLTVTGTSDFTLSANPTSRDIEPGETATYTITVNDGGSLPNYRVNFPDPSDADGMTATIDPSYLDPTSATNSVTLTILTDATVLEGIYSITVEAGGGGHTAGVTVTLNVSEAPVPESAGLTVDKSVTPSSAKVGGMLLYTVHIGNTGRGTLTDIVIRDNMPAGVGYVKGSTLINGRSAPDPSGTTTLIWEIDDLKGGDTTTLKYHGVVKPNISRGRSTNTVTVIGTDPTGRTLTARASANLGVSSEDLDRKGKIKGKVFIDENGNGLKNVDEEGVAGIWVLLESGERTTTDEEGMFQFDEVDSGEHLVGIDVRKLSKQYYVVGEYSKIVSLFSGGTGRTYFGLGRTGPSKEELEEMKKAEEEKKKLEEEALKEEQKKKEEENAPKGTIFGNVFVDTDGNGIYNPGEKLVEKVTVLLDAEKSSVSDKVGNYRFTKVKVGRHTLSIRQDKEFKKTYRLIKKDKITVNVKANTKHRQDIPVSDKRELKINIELTVR